MKAFVINLTRRADKREAILSEGEKHGIQLDVMEAVNGSLLSENELQNIVFDYPACTLTKGVVGCALSHLKIYKKIMDENIPIALVLEDDAILHPALKTILEKIELLNNGQNPEVTLLSSHYYAPRVLRKLTDEYSIHEFLDGSLGHGYVLNAKAAESLYKNLMPVKWEADKWYYFKQMGLVSVNCVVPHIIKAHGEASHSDLYAERILLKRKRRKYLNRRLVNVVKTRQRIKKILWKIFKRPFVKKS